jgi:ketosteroid isomerase-like protein
MLHPGYVGWDMSSPGTHDAAAAVLSVCGDSPRLEEYTLRPLSVKVYSGHTGVVHYTYEATVAPKGATRMRMTGKWTEVYVKEAGRWLMVAVAGRPETREAVQ